MTIALGILATDGIVLAADTQLGVTDFLKMQSGKIALSVSRALGDPGAMRSFGITGAGSADYLDALRPRMIKVAATGDEQPIEELEQILQADLMNFYSAHVVPFDRYSANERPDISLIMAAQHGPKKLLWATDKNLLIAHHQYAAVGIGTMYARILMNRLYVEASVEVAGLLAAYIIFQVKKHVDGCGEETDIFVLRDKGLPSFIDRDVIGRMEDIFKGYSKIEAGALLHVLGGAYPSFPSLESISYRLTRARDDMRGLFSQGDPLNPPPTTTDPSLQPPSPESPEGSGES